MRTFVIETLGCKVNQYESEQIAALLRARGLVEVDRVADADLRVVNSCSVTVQAASKSRQAVRRMTRLPVLAQGSESSASLGLTQPSWGSRRPRVLVTGCWATGDRASAESIPGVDGVLGHHDDVAEQLDRLLSLWLAADDPAARSRKPLLTHETPTEATQAHETPCESPPAAWGDKGRIIRGKPTVAPAGELDAVSKSPAGREVNFFPENPKRQSRASAAGTTRLPLLAERQSHHQRAFLKVQDGCDAHCTYCIIPQLRPSLWSKPIDDALEEARRLVASGHVELVLTGIFLGAFGQETALRRRQHQREASFLARLVDALCTQVLGVRRLRLSSLEPGDLTDSLIDSLRAHAQVVPHFHLPLQSGSDQLLRRMNRQYTRDDFLRMIGRVRESFDRPALTTDVIVGFPGETDDEFARTVEIVDRAGFIHVHAFSFSPRPRTAAARWTQDFVRGPVVNDRIAALQALAAAHSLAFRRQFVGETVELLVERQVDASAPLRHGRCARYFDVHFEGAARPGDFVTVRVDRVTPHRTLGTLVSTEAR